MDLTTRLRRFRYPIVEFVLEEKLASSHLANPRLISPRNYGHLKSMMFTHYLRQQPFPEKLRALIENGAIPCKRRTGVFFTPRRRVREGHCHRVDPSGYIATTDFDDTAAVVD
ncbi:hypothetical protein K435DRAFT_862592 [Dendrothele bispora CBS 962.96]|uniref:Uncharacterized protein n=1 Tax=Dendrothele bispora (strain CBS 962.96) TaxID=1314807 RepID=A0A4S8LST2_DENBC|nr:hypothetical protein K435DRAFT_862592 [Dendrothele bispora CBS 962.96]